MATSNQERLKLGSPELNDGIGFTIESLTFSPAQKKPLYASNADADGEALVRESHYTNASLELKVRIEPQKSVHAGLEKLGELTDAIQACEKIAGGQPLEWTPATTEDTYTLYALSADVTGIPIEVSGDDAGWLFGSPVVTIKITCRPFLYAAERTVLTATESGAEPLQVVYVGGIGGDVPAEARLIVKDTASQDRRFANWGRDIVVSGANAPLVLTANSGLSGSGFSGSLTTRSGAYGSEKVFRALAIPSPTTLCGTGRIENVGSFAVYLRVYTSTENTRFRIACRNGDGPLRPLEWKQPTVPVGWSRLFVGEVTFDAVQAGLQTSEIRVEQKTVGARSNGDCNFIELIPTTRASAVARGIFKVTTTQLQALDSFESIGNLEGKALPYPAATSWAQVNKTGESGFKVIAGGLIERSKTGESAWGGCYALAGTAKYATTGLRAMMSSNDLAGSLVQGLIARYSSTENWVMATLTGAGYLGVGKRVGGVVTVLASSEVALLATGSAEIQVGFYVDSFGTFHAEALNQATGQVATAYGFDAALASSGSLAEGRIGLYDQGVAGSHARTIAAFEALAFDPVGRACYSGKQVEFNSRECIRQDATGAYDGQPTSHRGGNFFLEPAGDLGLINRIAVAMRRNDVEVEEDSVVTDKQKVEVLARERYLMPR